MVLEIFNTSKIPVKVKSDKWINFKPQIEIQDGEVLHSEIVQSTFFDTQSLKEFSNYCPSSAVQKINIDDPEDGMFKQRYQVLTMEDIAH